VVSKGVFYCCRQNGWLSGLEGTVREEEIRYWLEVLSSACRTGRKMPGWMNHLDRRKKTGDQPDEKRGCGDRLRIWEQETIKSQRQIVPVEENA